MAQGRGRGSRSLLRGRAAALRTSEGRPSMRAPHLTAARIFLMSLASMVMACPLLPPGQAQQKSGIRRRNSPSRELHKVGGTVPKAVLDENIQTLLSYQPPDLRS